MILYISTVNSYRSYSDNQTLQLLRAIIKIICLFFSFYVICALNVAISLLPILNLLYFLFPSSLYMFYISLMCGDKWLIWELSGYLFIYVIQELIAFPLLVHLPYPIGVAVCCLHFHSFQKFVKFPMCFHLVQWFLRSKLFKLHLLLWFPQLFLVEFQLYYILIRKIFGVIFF